MTDGVRRTLEQVQRSFRGLPAMDAERWRSERAIDDDVFGPDDPTDDPWSDG